MIICAIDDLIFSIKISTTAKHLGADVFFERTAAGIVPRVREKQPSLVIFDLNSTRLRPMEAIAAFMQENQDFIVDKNAEKFLFTFNPNGYLWKKKAEQKA